MPSHREAITSRTRGLSPGRELESLEQDQAVDERLSPVSRALGQDTDFLAQESLRPCSKSTTNEHR